MPITDTFDLSEEKFSAAEYVQKYHTSFETVIVVFSQKTISALVENKIIEKLEDVSFSSTHNQYYVYKYPQDVRVLIFACPIGAPSTVAFLEEVTCAFSIKNVILYGSAGILDRTVSSGRIIVPTKAYRDEGTSYHYQPSADFIDVPNHIRVAEHLKQIGVKYVEGYTWTTDAFYRETVNLVNQRREQGCLAVEMEISAVQAFCNFRKLQFYTFIYGADNLSSSTWEIGLLGNLQMDERMNHFAIALSLATNL